MQFVPLHGHTKKVYRIESIERKGKKKDNSKCHDLLIHEWANENACEEGIKAIVVGPFVTKLLIDFKTTFQYP
jgi:hypothetical protein